MPHRIACLLIGGLLLSTSLVWAEDWPQWRGPQRDGVWNERNLLDKFDQPQLEVRWRAPIGPGYSGPTVADDRVFVSDRQLEPKPTERILCFDAKSGQPLWQHSYPCEYSISYTAGPRASITIDDNCAYALGAMGHLHCLDVGTGTVLWKKDLNKQYQIESSSRAESRMPIWGLAAAPLIYRDLVILHIGGRDGACIVALEKDSGDEVWRALRDRASYSAPILVEQGGRDVVVCWTGDSVAGLDPRDGKVHWRFPFPPTRMPIGISTPVVSGDRLFVTSFYDGALMLRLKDDLNVEKVWQLRGPNERQTEGLHSIISTPVFAENHVYGVDSYGELRCLDAATGKRLWEDRTATPRARWSNIHFVRNGERYWLFNERGELIIAQLQPTGYREISRTRLIKPTLEQLRRRDGVCWAHPAFADGHVFIRNDEELVCASLEAD